MSGSRKKTCHQCVVGVPFILRLTKWCISDTPSGKLIAAAAQIQPNPEEYEDIEPQHSIYGVRAPNSLATDGGGS